MAIQMRRGQYKDFDPGKMLPGEWAVAIDNDTQHQVIWMCFHSGVVKRIGTYEDFHDQIEEATGDIRDLYVSILNEIKDDTQALQTAAAKSEANAKASETAAAASQAAAKKSENAADDWSQLAESFAHGLSGARPTEDTDNAEYYCRNAQTAKETAVQSAETATSGAANAQRYCEQTEAAAENAIKELQDALALVLPQWHINFETGHLEYEGGRFNWQIATDNGHLLWEVAA